MKRVVSSSLISVFIIIAVAAGIIYYQQYSAKGAHAFDCIPNDASFVISCKQTSASIRQLARSSYWKDVRNAPLFNKTSIQLSFFDSAITNNATLRDAINTHPLWLSFHVTSANDFDILFLTENINYTQADAWIHLLASKEPAIRNYNGVDIREIATAFGMFSYTVIRGVFAGSFSSFLIEDAIRQQRSSNKLKDLVLEKAGDPVLFINHKQLPAWLAVYLDASRKDKIAHVGAFADRSTLAFNINENEINFNGITNADTASYLHSLAAQQPVKFSMKKILPAKTAAIIWFGVSDWNTYLPSLKNYFKLNAMSSSTLNRCSEMEKRNHISLDAQWLYWLGNEYALVVTEPVSTNYDNTCYAVFKTTDLSKAVAALARLAEKANAASGNKQQNEERYNGHVIRYLDLPGILPAMFGGLFNRINRFYYTDMEGYIIVANQPSSLRSLINDNATGNMATDDKQLNSMLNRFPATGNFCFYSNISASTYLVRSIASQSTIDFIDLNKKAWSHCDALFYSATTQPNKTFKAEAFFHYKSEDKKGVHQLWNCSLDTMVIGAPQFISDSTNGIRVLVQDANNTLYKIDNSGNIAWKKKLDTRVLSAYYPVNPHHNQQPCYVFNTRSFIYMLDGNGNNCPGYPIRLPAMATNGISLVDYYGTGDYRLFLACGNMSMYGWLLDGKPLGGWYFNKTQKTIADSLQYFRFGSNDYLVFTDEEFNLYALNKMGQHQIKGKTVLKKQGTRYYPFASIDSSFQLMMMDTSGAISLLKEKGITPILTPNQTGSPLAWLPLDVNADGQDDFALLHEQGLKVLSNDNLTLASRSFTEKMNAWINKFTLSDGKTRMGMYSSDAGNIYLIEKDGSVMKGFPVGGSTAFDVMNSQQDNRSYLITGSGSNVYLYGIN